MRSSEWFGVVPAEIVAAHLWRGLGARDRKMMFSAVNKEAELLRPVATWFKSKGFDVYAEVPAGRHRIDLVAINPGGIFKRPQLIAVELKNSLSQMKRGLDQMTTFGQYATEVYLACTPAMAAEYLDTHARVPGVKHWDATVLQDKLEAFGFGLLLVSVNFDNIEEAIKPQRRTAKAACLSDVVDTLKRMETI
jgi:hypothetical protein